MPAQVKSALDKLTGAVKEFSLAQRTLALIGLAVLVLGAVALSSWLSKPAMSPLFTSLSGADAAAVVDELDAQGVPYELADGGATVMVPAQQIYTQRIRLAAAGIPQNADGAGYSLLDDMPMTSSEFQQEKTYQRALEGELARTIGAMDGIDSASVRLAMPEETVFTETVGKPTASVFVRSRAGKTPSKDQIEAITHLVAAGIPDMVPTDVALIDASGQVLSAVGVGATGRTTGEATEFEERVRSSVQAMLDRVVGAGKSAVTVTATLNFDESQRTTETFSATPDTPPLVSSRTSEEYTGAGRQVPGVLGEGETPVTTEDGGTYNSTTEDLQNAVNKTTEVVTAAPGSVERQSVAVVIDSAAAARLNLTDLQATIAAAAGIDTERGDTLALQSAAFDTTAAEAAQEAIAQADAAAKAEAQSNLIRQAVIAGLVVIAIIVVMIVLARRSRRARREAVDLGMLPMLDQPGGGAAGELEGLSIDDLPVLPPTPEPTTPDPVAVKRAEITALADEQPEEVAELLRGWLATPSGRR